MKHKWHDEIKAWADGAEIEVWYPEYAEWNDCINPMFDINTHQYRIKPQPKQPKHLYAIQSHTGEIVLVKAGQMFNGTLIGKIEVEDE